MSICPVVDVRTALMLISPLGMPRSKNLEALRRFFAPALAAIADGGYEDWRSRQVQMINLEQRATGRPLIEEWHVDRWEDDGGRVG